MGKKNPNPLNTKLVGSPRKLGKISNLMSIFFRWVGSTTNQITVVWVKLHFWHVAFSVTLFFIWNITLPATNIAPENGCLEDEFPFGMAQFQGLCQFQGGLHFV